jgi:hypothetical protein
MRINKKVVKIIAMVNDEWQYQPLNLGDGLPLKRHVCKD